MDKTKITFTLARGTGWEGWGGASTLYNYQPADAPIDAVMAALADKAREMQKSVSIVDNTHTRHRVVGWGYTPKGYADTPDGPKLWLMCIVGDTLP